MADRNQRVQGRYDELMREGKHGHYETMFRVVTEEVERCAKIAEGWSDFVRGPLQSGEITEEEWRINNAAAQTIARRIRGDNA